MPRHSTRPRASAPREVPDAGSLRADQRARRERIVDAAVELMLEVDYGDIQVKDVAERADVALGTLYRYFSSKDHLMAEALLKWSSGAPAPRPPRADTRLSERVASVYQRAARAFERQPRAFGALIQLQASGDPHAAIRFADFAEQQTASFGAALEGLPEATRTDVVNVMSAVLSEGLRGCQSGVHTHAELRRRIDRAAALVVSDAGTG